MLDAIATNIFDQISIEGLIRDVREEEAMKLLEQVRKNNEIILNSQKQLTTLEKENVKKKRRKQDRQWFRVQ